MTTWPATAVRAARIRAQLLGPVRAAGVAEVLDAVVAVQAQDARPARLAVRARSRGLVAGDVDAACRDAVGVRTWLMRGTLHLVRDNDVRWLLRLFGARNADRYAGRRRQLGLDEALCERALAALPGILRDGPLERAQIVEALGEGIDPASQAPAHLLMLAASKGLICRGPGDADYVLLDDWVPDTDDNPDDDLPRLATRYVAAHGPTGPADLAGWSGLPIGTARRAFAAAELVEIDTALGPLFVLPGQDRPSAGRLPVRLLGHFDGYLLGYRDRSLSVPPEHDKQVQSGGGFIMPTVLVDGRAVATWRTTQRRGATLVGLEPFGDAVMPEVSGEIADLARFLGKPVELAPADG
ncbi:MAG TPA: winged helix DNA-binding domain-containing protein [Pseudonocardiaceae bacterium]|nr:winged helix DNA-binding domain-containing protein [Pseudonocardiaceae bacterium]